MSSRLPTDEALEKEDRIDEIKKKKKETSSPIPHLLLAQQAPALPYAKVVGRPGTGSYPAPSPEPTTRRCKVIISHVVELHSSLLGCFPNIAMKQILVLVPSLDNPWTPPIIYIFRSWTFNFLSF